MPPGEAQRSKRIERQQGLLKLLADGMPVRKALDAMRIPEGTWRDWRCDDADFKREADALIRAKRDLNDTSTPQSLAEKFIRFREIYFGNDTPMHHAKMIDAIVGAQAESVTVMLAPPGHAKTTLMVDWICFRLARDPNYRVCVISETGSHAEKVLRQIARRMTDETNFGPFIARYGPFKPDGRDVMKPWNSTNLTHVQASHDEKEGSLEAKGAGDQIYGARYDEIWLDDIQSTKTLTQTEKLLTYFRQDVVTRPMDNGRIYDIGTRVGPSDFHEALMAEDDEGERIAANVLRLPAYDYRGEPLWPAVWPKERLEKRRAAIRSDEIWARVYMQKPVSNMSATFTEEHLAKCRDPQREVGQHAGGGVVVFGVDPALVGYTAIVTAHLTADKLELLDLVRRRQCASSENILALVEDQARKHRPRTGIFELTNFQGALFNDTRLAEISNRMGFFTRPHTTSKMKADPMFGVSGMVTSFARAEISIPWKGVHSQDRFRPLVEELLRWRADVPTKMLTQDTVLALWFVWRHWMLEVRPSLIAPPQSWRSRALPFAPAAWVRA